MDNYEEKKEMITNGRNILKEKNNYYYLRGSFVLFIVFVLGSFSSIAFQNGLLFLLTILVSGGMSGYYGRLISINKKKLTNLNNFEKNLDDQKEKQIKIDEIQKRLNNMSLAQLNSLKDLIMNYDLIDLVNDIIKYDCAELLFPDSKGKNMDTVIDDSKTSPSYDYKDDDKYEVKLDEATYELDNSALRRTRKRNNLVRFNYYKREK